MILRRFIRFVLRVIAVVVIAVLLAVLILRVTNPRPKENVYWRSGTAMPLARGEGASAMLDGRLVVVGGLKGVSSVSAAMSIYDVDNDRWQRGPSLPAGGRHHAAAAALDGRVYVTGGASSVFDWTPKRELAAYRPGHGPGHGWSTLPDMPEGRQGHAMVGLGHKLYVVGGVGRTDETLIYDVRTKEWTTGAALPEGRNHLRAIVWDGHIWAIGGRSGRTTGRVDVYDPKRDVWAPGPPLPVPMSAMAVGVINEKLHVVGGEDPRFFGGGVSDEHFVLPFDTKRWEPRPQPLLPVHGAAYGVLDDRFVIAGGASRNGALSVISWTNVTQLLVARPNLQASRS